MKVAVQQKPGILNLMKPKKVLHDKKINKELIFEGQLAFERLYEKYASKIFGFLISHTDSTEKSEELLIKVFSKVWEQINGFQDNEEKKVMVILFSVCRDNKVCTSRFNDETILAK